LGHQQGAMPELPEVETVRRGLAPVLEGRRLTRVEARRPDLRFPLPAGFAERLRGALVERLDRRGKYLLAHLDTGQTLISHLGMSGRYTIVAEGQAAPARLQPNPSRPRSVENAQIQKFRPLSAEKPDATFSESGLARFQPNPRRPRSVENAQIQKCRPLSAEKPDATFSENSLGDFYYAAPPDPAHTHVVLETDQGVRVEYNDPRRFGYMDLVDTAGLDACTHFAGMGPEPLGNGFSAAHLEAAFAGKKQPVKAALLDQRTVAGLGNIYVCEALYRAGIAPTRAAGKIASKRLAPLAAMIRTVLEEAVEAGGSSLRNHASAEGALGYFQHRFSVYDRAGEDCRTPGCHGVVKRIVQTGRSTFFCPRCQR
jgi:formamidopyrimidine-DNA glycosylase